MRSIYIGLFCLALTACASTPQNFAKVAQTPGGRIGVIDTLEPEITVFHQGLTVFGNVNNRLTNDWNLPGYAQAQVTELLKQGGYQVTEVNLSPAEVEKLRNRDDQDASEQSGLDKSWTEKYRAILRDNRLDALVVLRDRPISGNLRGGAIYHGYGIHWIRAPWPMNRYNDKLFIFNSTYADVIGGDPPHRSANNSCARAQVDRNSPQFAKALAEMTVNLDELHVDDLKDVKASDMPWLRPRLEANIAKRMTNEIKTSGLLGTQPCPDEAVAQAPLILQEAQ